jgi:DNA-binding protein WhiA
VLERYNWNNQLRAAADHAALAARALDALGDIPPSLEQAARLRIANPEASMAQLGVLADPPATKNAIKSRLRRLLAMAAKAERRDR